MLWIGDRTRQPDARPCRVLRRHPQPDRHQVRPEPRQRRPAAAARQAEPDNEAGRITLISPLRLGQGRTTTCRASIETVKRPGSTVVWCSDPMHGNTVKASTGYKTRPFDRVLSEVKRFFDMHREMGTYAGGIHIEMTGDDVTECTGGGVAAITEAGLSGPLPHLLRPAAQCQPGAGTGLPRRRGIARAASGSRNPGRRVKSRRLQGIWQFSQY